MDEEKSISGITSPTLSPPYPSIVTAPFTSLAHVCVTTRGTTTSQPVSVKDCNIALDAQRRRAINIALTHIPIS